MWDEQGPQRERPSPNTMATPHNPAPQNALATTIWWASVASLSGVALFCVTTAMLAPQAFYTYAIALVYGIGGAAVLALVKADRLPVSVVAFVVQNWLAATGFAVVEGPSSGHVGVYFIAVLLAGLLISSRAAVLTGLLSAAVIGSLGLGHEFGLVFPQDSTSPAPHLFAQLIVAGLLTAIATRGQHQALTEARDAKTRFAELFERTPGGLLASLESGR